MSDKQGLYLSGVSDAEAKEFHGGFMMGMIVFVAVAVVAHYLVWIWRPWLSAPGKSASLENIQQSITSITSLLT